MPFLPHDRSLSDVQEAAQILGGEQFPRVLISTLLDKSDIKNDETLLCINLTPYDAWLEKTLSKWSTYGLTHKFKSVSLTKQLPACQYVEKSLAIEFLEDWAKKVFFHNYDTKLENLAGTSLGTSPHSKRALRRSGRLRKTRPKSESGMSGLTRPPHLRLHVM